MGNRPGLFTIVWFVMLCLAGLGFLFWLIFYSLPLANLPWVIRARNYYHFKLRQPFSLFPMQIINIGGRDYFVYVLSGRLENIDFNKRQLMVKDRRGQVYSFLFPPFSTLAFDDVRDGMVQTLNIEIDDVRSELTENPFLIGDKLNIHWADTLTFTQILSTINDDPERIVNREVDLPYFLMIRKFSNAD